MNSPALSGSRTTAPSVRDLTPSEVQAIAMKPAQTMNGSMQPTSMGWVPLFLVFEGDAAAFEGVAAAEGGGSVMGRPL